MFLLYCDEIILVFFFFSSRRRHTRFDCDWSSDVCSSDLRHRMPQSVPVTTVTPVRFINPTSSTKRLNIFVRPAAAFTYRGRSEERRVGKECRSRWSP